MRKHQHMVPGHSNQDLKPGEFNLSVVFHGFSWCLGNFFPHLFPSPAILPAMHSCEYTSEGLPLVSRFSSS